MQPELESVMRAQFYTVIANEVTNTEQLGLALRYVKSYKFRDCVTVCKNVDEGMLGGVKHSHFLSSFFVCIRGVLIY